MSAENPTPERFSIQSVIQGIIDTFDVNKGFIKTYRLLTTRPGESMRRFLAGERTLLTKPFKLLLVSTAVAAFMTFQLAETNPFMQGIDKGMEVSKKENDGQSIKPIEETAGENETNGQPGQSTKSAEEIEKDLEKKRATMEKIGDMYQRYFNLIILLSIPFMALATFWFFKKSGFNYAEHIVFNSYILSYQNLVYLFFFPLIYFASFHFTWLYMAVSYIFFGYACIRFFETKPWVGAGKSILALLIGMFLYMVFIFILIAVVTVVLITTGE